MSKKKGLNLNVAQMATEAWFHASVDRGAYNTSIEIAKLAVGESAPNMINQALKIVNDAWDYHTYDHIVMWRNRLKEIYLKNGNSTYWVYVRDDSYNPDLYNNIFNLYRFSSRAYALYELSMIPSIESQIITLHESDVRIWVRSEPSLFIITEENKHLVNIADALGIRVDMDMNEKLNCGFTHIFFHRGKTIIVDGSALFHGIQHSSIWDECRFSLHPQNVSVAKDNTHPAIQTFIRLYMTDSTIRPLFLQDNLAEASVFTEYLNQYQQTHMMK